MPKFFVFDVEKPGEVITPESIPANVQGILDSIFFADNDEHKVATIEGEDNEFAWIIFHVDNRGLLPKINKEVIIRDGKVV